MFLKQGAFLSITDTGKIDLVMNYGKCDLLPECILDCGVNFDHKILMPVSIPLNYSVGNSNVFKSVQFIENPPSSLIDYLNQFGKELFNLSSFNCLETIDSSAIVSFINRIGGSSSIRSYIESGVPATLKTASFGTLESKTIIDDRELLYYAPLLKQEFRDLLSIALRDYGKDAANNAYLKALTTENDNNIAKYGAGREFLQFLSNNSSSSYRALCRILKLIQGD